MTDLSKLTADFLEEQDGDFLLDLVYDLRDDLIDILFEMRCWWNTLCHMTSEEFAHGGDKQMREQMQARLAIDESGNPSKETP